MSPRYASVKDHVHAQSLVIQDPLAADRTILANERTFLAYIRTATTLLIGGLSLISFFPSNIMKLLGLAAIIPATLLFSIGAKRYYFLKKYLTG